MWEQSGRKSPESPRSRARGGGTDGAAASAEARGGDRRRTREPGSWVSGGTRTVPMGFRRAGTGEGCEAVRGQSGPHWKGADWEKPGASQRPPEPTVGRRRPRGERGPRLPPRPLDPATRPVERERGRQRPTRGSAEPPPGRLPEAPPPEGTHWGSSPGARRLGSQRGPGRGPPQSPGLRGGAASRRGRKRDTARRGTWPR